MIHLLHKKEVKPWLLALAIIFFILVLLIPLSLWAWDLGYEGKIYPGVHAGRIDLGGKTLREAEKEINQLIDQLNETGMPFEYGSHRAPLYPTVASADAEFAYAIIDFNVADTAEEAMSFGRNKNFLANFKDRLGAAISDHQLELKFSLDEAGARKALAKNFARFENPAKDAELVYSNGNFSISEEKAGRTIDYNSALLELKANLAQAESRPISLRAKDERPSVYKIDILNVNTEADRYLSLAPLVLKYGDKTWQIEKQNLALWLGLKPNPDTTASAKAIIGIKSETAENFLKETIAPQIDRQSVESKFEIKNGRVTEFKGGSDGIELDIASSLTKIEDELIRNGQHEVELVVNKITKENLDDSTNSLGIKEIIGTGQSSFAGSPKNRRQNIKVGANSLHGVLIKPGETFSLLKALGKIDGTTGYLTELVIKDNKTIPEFGGGLCQIGTTVFRAALESGLPIVERRNHSYRVGYYEPAGTDATIYDPAPDFKFMNDTANHILIQERFEGDKLFFDFWGTKDGRVSERTQPTIYNIVKPKPAKIIETTDLKPGQKKCTEKAHNGADAFFDYKVTYTDGRVANKKFSSHYVPWQEVCLVGVDKSKAADAKATTTPATDLENKAATSSQPTVTATSTATLSTSTPSR